MNKLVMDIVNNGISLEMYKGSTGIEYMFQNGFYKSDGCAHLYEDDGKIYLRTRYGQINEVNSFDDVIAVSQDWYESSCNRFKGWSNPASPWGDYYI